MNERPQADSALLVAANVSKIYDEGRVQALSDVSVAIGRGEYVSVMGPSGSGKSTLLHMLGALDRPSQGEILFEGSPLSQIKNLDYFRSQRVGFVFQSFHLLPVLTASENVQVPMFETKRSARQRAARAGELLELVNLSHRVDHLPSQLSVGERQRVAIARALANDPAVLLADEPTGSLDSSTAAEIVELFAQLHQQHRATVVIVTHDNELAEQAERTIRMRDGQIVT